MTINCDLNESDYKAFRRFVLFRYRKMHWLISVVLVSLLALDWFSYKPNTPTAEKVAGIVGLLVVWAIIMLGFMITWKLLARFTGGRFRGSVGPHVFDISEEAFSESNSQRRQEVHLEGLRRVAETDSHFFVLTNTGTGYVIPKRDLKSYDALHALQKRVAKRG